MSIRTLILVGVGTFILGVLMQPVIFPKPPQKRTFVPEGHADKVQNPSEKLRIPEIQPLPQFVPQTENVQVDPNTLQDLQQHKLSLPVQGVQIGNMRNSFSEMRGDHIHEAVDILAPRDTPVVAVEDGKIAKLFFSVRGGNTIYHFDPTRNLLLLLCPSGSICFRYPRRSIH